MVYDRADQLDFTFADAPAWPRPARVLLVRPDHFEVAYVINPHMAGHVGTVDRAAALRQWERVRAAYETLGFTPLEVEAPEGYPDAVFCANTTLPFYDADGGEHGVFLSTMRAAERQGEVEPIAALLRRQGHQVKQPPERGRVFEGCGDALWHPGRAVLWGGFGYRTDPAIYEALSQALGVPVLRLRLVDPDFYHLDTCLCLLDEEHALYTPAAFDAEGIELLETIPTLIAVPEAEARHGFACNAHSPDGEHVLIHSATPETQLLLREAGFTPVPVDTSEFIKAGGSVFCMKQMLW